MHTAPPLIGPAGPTTVLSPDEVNNRFTFHPPAEAADEADRIARHERVRELCRTLAHELNVMLPPGHLSERALDTLGDVMCQANMAIACAAQPAPQMPAIHEVPQIASSLTPDPGSLGHGSRGVAQ